MIRRALARRVGHERHLIGTHLADQRDELRRRIAFDVVFDRRPEFVADQRRELGDVGAADVALVRARVHGDAMGAGLDHQSSRVRHARIADVALVAQQRHLVEVDAQLGFDGSGHRSPPARHAGKHSHKARLRQKSVVAAQPRLKQVEEVAARAALA